MKKSLICLVLVLFMSACSKTEYTNFERLRFSKLTNVQIQDMSEGRMLKGNIGNLRVSLLVSYYSDNCYEFDVKVIPSIDTLQIKSFRDNGIPFVIADSPSKVDLDYHRLSNVFFDTINGMPAKIIMPRVPFSQNYKIFIAELPGTYLKNIGYKSLTVTFENIKSKKDIETFEKFYRNIEKSYY